MLGFGGDNLYLVATLQLMAQWYQLVVNFGSNTMRAQEGMDGEGKVEGCTACRHRLDFSLGREDKDF